MPAPPGLVGVISLRNRLSSSRARVCGAVDGARGGAPKSCVWRRVGALSRVEAAARSARAAADVVRLSSRGYDIFLSAIALVRLNDDVSQINAFEQYIYIAYVLSQY